MLVTEAPVHRNWHGLNAKQVIDRLGIGTDLELCLDAGDGTSWPGSGTKWNDLSGNGYDFYLGNDATTTSDPTFNGTVGGLSKNEYWSFDGGDYFRYDSANEAWMNNLHKAGSAFSALAVMWVPALDTYRWMGTSQGSTSNVGIVFELQNSGRGRLIVSNGTGSAALNENSGTDAYDYPAQQWFTASLLYTETDRSHVMLDGWSKTYSDNIASPSAANATYTMEIGSRGNGNQPLPNLSRMAVFAMWSRALPLQELNSFRRALNVRFVS